MQILVNTDNHINGGQNLAGLVEEVLQGTLGRFGERITRVEVHLTDENSREKEGSNDKRCVLEARLAGLQPIAVSEQGATVEQAIGGAVDRLENTLDRTLQRLDDPKGRPSFAGDQTQ